METHEPYIETFTGKKFHFLNPAKEEVDLIDIGHALANQCRFTGHTKYFYSVAEHCVLVAALVKEAGGTIQQQLQGLLHDATEAYLTDVAKPVKGHLANYKEMEARLWAAVAGAFDVPVEMFDIVHEADLQALLIEARSLLPSGGKEWHESMGYTGKLPDWRPICLVPAAARHAWLKTFDNLAGTNVIPSLTVAKQQGIILPDKTPVVVNG